jgi:hypothetical protein
MPRFLAIVIISVDRKTMTRIVLASISRFWFDASALGLGVFEDVTICATEGELFGIDVGVGVLPPAARNSSPTSLHFP